MKRIVRVELDGNIIDLEIEVLSNILKNDSHHIDYLVKKRLEEVIESAKVIDYNIEPEKHLI